MRREGIDLNNDFSSAVHFLFYAALIQTGILTLNGFDMDHKQLSTNRSSAAAQIPLLPFSSASQSILRGPIYYSYVVLSNVVRSARSEGRAVPIDSTHNEPMSCCSCSFSYSFTLPTSFTLSFFSTSSFSF